MALVNESIVEYDSIQRHDCTLLHWCRLRDEGDILEWKRHKEHDGIKLIWKTFDELGTKPLYPEGALEVIEKKDTNEQRHLVVRKTY